MFNVLNAHLRLNMWPWIVALQLEVLKLKVEDALHVGIDDHARQRAWLTRQLQPLGLSSSQTLISFHSAFERQLPISDSEELAEE